MLVFQFPIYRGVFVFVFVFFRGLTKIEIREEVRSPIIKDLVPK